MSTYDSEYCPQLKSILRVQADTTFSRFPAPPQGIAPFFVPIPQWKRAERKAGKASSYLSPLHQKSHVPEASEGDAVYHVAMLKSTLRNPAGSAAKKGELFVTQQLNFCTLFKLHLTHI